MKWEIIEWLVSIFFGWKFFLDFVRFLSPDLGNSLFFSFTYWQIITNKINQCHWQLVWLLKNCVSHFSVAYFEYLALIMNYSFTFLLVTHFTGVEVIINFFLHQKLNWLFNCVNFSLLCLFSTIRDTSKLDIGQ